MKKVKYIYILLFYKTDDFYFVSLADGQSSVNYFENLSRSGSE